VVSRLTTSPIEVAPFGAAVVGLVVRQGVPQTALVTFTKNRVPGFLYPGMTQFYYEMLEHIWTIYKYTMATIFLTIYKEETGNHLQILQHEKSDTINLQPTDLSSASEIDPLLVHLLNGALLARRQYGQSELELGQGYNLHHFRSRDLYSKNGCTHYALSATHHQGLSNQACICKGSEENGND
jgi:hypothetical protein